MHAGETRPPLSVMLLRRCSCRTTTRHVDANKCRVQDLLEFLRQRAGQCGLIYARKRETCTSLAQSLRCHSPL